ncbi:MAG: hypothetical protein AAFY28_05835 [Actinomycetota bacterium]
MSLDASTVDDHHLCCALGDPKHEEGVTRILEWRLWALPVDRRSDDDVDENDRPHFAESMRSVATADDEQFVARYDDQCPFNAYWSGEVVESLRRRGNNADAVRVMTREEAHASRSPLGTFALKCDGALVCHHLTVTARHTGCSTSADQSERSSALRFPHAAGCRASVVDGGLWGPIR